MSVYIVGRKAKTVAGPRLVFGTPPKEWNLPSEAIAEAQRLAGMSPDAGILRVQGDRRGSGIPATPATCPGDGVVI
jgi:hypothetical protein